MANKDVVRCKQCGKIIVGKSKVGLCEQCASKDLKVAGGAGLLTGGLILKYRKPIGNAIKAAAKFIFRL